MISEIALVASLKVHVLNDDLFRGMVTPSEAALPNTPLLQQDTSSFRQLSDSHVTEFVSNIQHSGESSTPAATLRLGNLWKALQSVHIRTLHDLNCYIPSSY